MPTADELFSRQTPYSLEAEQAVLGSMLIDPHCVTELIGVLKAEDFYIETNRLVFETIAGMFNDCCSAAVAVTMPRYPPSMFCGRYNP